MAAGPGGGTLRASIAAAAVAADKQDVHSLTRAAEDGDANAQAELGFRFYEGNGVPKDYHAAVKWYTKAAEQGDPRGQNNLGWMRRGGW